MTSEIFGTYIQEYTPSPDSSLPATYFTSTIVLEKEGKSYLPGPKKPLPCKASLHLPWQPKIEQFDGKAGDTRDRKTYLGTFTPSDDGKTVTLRFDFTQSCREKSRGIYKLQHPRPTSCCGKLCACIEDFINPSPPIGGGALLGIGSTGGFGIQGRPELIFSVHDEVLECVDMNSDGKYKFGPDDAESKSYIMAKQKFRKGKINDVAF